MKVIFVKNKTYHTGRGMEKGKNAFIHTCIGFEKSKMEDIILLIDIGESRYNLLIDTKLKCKWFINLRNLNEIGNDKIKNVVKPFLK